MKTINLCIKAFTLISKKRLLHVAFLIVVTFVNIFFEVLSIGAIIPFTTSLLGKNTDFHIFSDINLFNFFNNFINEQSIINLGIIFSLLLFISLIIKIFLIWFSNYLAFSIGHEINSLMFKTLLDKNYDYHLKSNSSAFLGGFQKSESIRVLIYHFIQIFISFSILGSISLFCLFLNKELFFFGICSLFFFYYFFFILLKKKILYFSKIEAKSINNRFKIIQESFLSIKELIMLDLKNYFFSKFKEQDKRISRVQIFNSISAVIPGQLMLAFILIFITMTVSILATNNQQTGIINNIPIIASLFFSIQRITPYLQNIFNAFTKIKSSTYSVEDALKILEGSKNNYHEEIFYKRKLKFIKSIKLKNIFFKYNSLNKFILKDFNLTIKKGSLNGIYARSGYGKTTLLNIITGLLKPNSGKIFIDDELLQDKNLKIWQKKIFYISQDPAFLDASIIENITYKNMNDSIDQKKLTKCLEVAEIYDFIYSLKDTVNTIIGEKGIKFSGGQKQRIAIARALFHNRDILILDEATNALDEKTEQKIYSNIKKYFYNKTIIAISHRKSLYKNFQYIIKLK